MGTREHLSAIKSVTWPDETLQWLLFLVSDVCIPSALQTDRRGWPATVCLKTLLYYATQPALATSYEAETQKMRRIRGYCSLSLIITFLLPCPAIAMDGQSWAPMGANIAQTHHH